MNKFNRDVMSRPRSVCRMNDILSNLIRFVKRPIWFRGLQLLQRELQRGAAVNYIAYFIYLFFYMMYLSVLLLRDGRKWWNVGHTISMFQVIRAFSFGKWRFCTQNQAWDATKLHTLFEWKESEFELPKKS